MKIANLFSKKKISNNIYYQSLLDISNNALWSSRNYHTFAENGYVKNVIAFRAIRMVAVSLSSIELQLYYCDENGKHKITDHPLLRLLKKPNSNLASNNLLEGIASYKLISGNAYILKIAIDNKPQELHLLRPDRMSIIVSNNKEIAGYRYQINSEHKDYMINPITGYSDILHLKTFNPLDDWYGLSAVEAASYSIDQHNQAIQWNQAFLQNGARPCGALIVKSSSDGGNSYLSEEQYQRIRNQLDDLYSGTKNNGRPLLLEGGLEWKEMGASHRDMDFINMKDGAARDIALAFGVPPQLLGIPGDNTYSNLIEARLALWEQTVLPMAETLINNLNNWLVPSFGNNLLLDYNKDAIEALTYKREKLWSFIRRATFMTINEKREAVGLGPIEGGNVLGKVA